MVLPILAVLLPTLYWDRPVETAEALHKAGVDRLCVAPGREPAWRKAGFAATAFDRARAREAVAPHVEYKMDEASATRAPWIDANGWRYLRAPGKTFFSNVPTGSAALAAAEAFAYGADAAIGATPDDVAPFARMTKFLAAIERAALPAMANIGVVDDGSDTMGEVLNLLARHNLLFQLVPKADPTYAVNIQVTAEAAKPYEFAIQVRHELTDERRLLRIYGSNVVIGRLTGNGSEARVHLLNYGKGVVRGLRVRVLGVYAHGKLADFGRPTLALADYSAEDGATEFTLPELGPYAIVDLER